MDTQLIIKQLEAINGLVFFIKQEINTPTQLNQPTVEVMETPDPPADENPLGEVTDEAWLCIKITNKTMAKNTAMIWYTFQGIQKDVAYYYTPEKIDYDQGFAWNVEEGKYYIVHNQKWSYKDRWVWNKFWEIDETAYHQMSFKCSKRIPPSLDMLRMLEEQVYASTNMTADLNEVQKSMWLRACNRRSFK